jgi:hypothetical protein
MEDDQLDTSVVRPPTGLPWVPTWAADGHLLESVNGPFLAELAHARRR